VSGQGRVSHPALSRSPARQERVPVSGTREAGIACLAPRPGREADEERAGPAGRARQRARHNGWSRSLPATVYDSQHLALAETVEGDLWTGDRRLCQAVGLPCVRCVDEGSRTV
jgi:hypothetical protein